MDENEAVLDLSTYPREGTTSTSKVVIFGPVSDKVAFLAEIDPITGEIQVTAGNTPGTSLMPRFLGSMLRELADEIEAIESRSDFQEFIYGTPVEDDDE